MCLRPPRGVTREDATKHLLPANRRQTKHTSNGHANQDTFCSVYIIFRVLGYAMEMCIHQQFATRFCDQSLQEVRLSHIILWCILRMYIQITLLYIFTVLRLLLSRQLVSFQDRVFITNLQVMADSCIYSNKVCKFYLCVFFGV